MQTQHEISLFKASELLARHSFHLVRVLLYVYIKPATFLIVDQKNALVQYLKKNMYGTSKPDFPSKKDHCFLTAEMLRLAGHFQLGFKICSTAINFQIFLKPLSSDILAH